MTGWMLPIAVALPLLMAAVLLGRAWPRRFVTTVLLGSTGAVLAMGFGLVVTHGLGQEVLVHQIGLWPSGIAIPFVSDMFSALMLTVTGILMVTCAGFSVASGDTKNRQFAPLVLVLCAGVAGALLTGDVFNLFVFIEVMLLPSYGLIAMVGGGRRIGAGRLYVTMNLLTSTIFLMGVGFVYGVTGTVNLAELAGAARESPTVAIAMGVVLIALSIKASVVPVHGWLARTYPATSPAVTALFSGLHTKVAIYAIYRIYAVVFDGDPAYLWIGVVAMSATMIIGVLGAVGEETTRSILAFHMVSQIGYILLGVFLFGLAGLTAGIFYLLHHMIVKASLFLSTGAVEVTYGSRPLGEVRGIARREPIVAVAFLMAALSLSGLPPFSGFLAKLTLVLAAVDVGQLAAAGVAVVVSLFTLMSMMKIWTGMFWGRPDDETSSGSGTGTAVRARTRIRAGLAAPAVVLALITLSLGVGGEALLTLSEQAAAGLVDTTGYVEAVVGS